MPFTLVRHTIPDVADGLCYSQLDVSLRTSFIQEAAVVLRQLYQRARRTLSACQSEPKHLVYVTHAGVIKAASVGTDSAVSNSQDWNTEINYDVVLSWPAND